MAFFQRIDALGVAEDHAQRVLSMEQQEAERLIRRYEKVAQDIRRRLQNLPEDTFSAQFMRGVLLQIEAAMVAFEKDMQGEIGGSVRKIVRQGTEDTLAEIRRFNDEFRGAVQPMDIDTNLAATQTSDRLFNEYQASLERYSQDLRHKLAANLRDMQLQNLTKDQMLDRMLRQRGIEKFFAGESWRLRRIVRTETHDMYGTAKQELLTRIADEHEPAMKKALYHPMDSRTADDSKFLLAQAELPESEREARVVVPVKEPFEYYWGGDRRQFMNPPDRPNDRSTLIPFHDSWDSN